MSDEQKSFDEQPEYVKNAIEDLISDNDDGGLFRSDDVKKVNPDFDEQAYYDEFGIDPEFAPEKLSLSLGDLTQAERVDVHARNGRYVVRDTSFGIVFARPPAFFRKSFLKSFSLDAFPEFTVARRSV